MSIWKHRYYLILNLYLHLLALLDGAYIAHELMKLCSILEGGVKYVK